MMQTMRHSGKYIVLGLAMWLWACEPDATCYQEMTTNMIVTLQADSVDAEGNTHTYQTWDSLYVQGVGSATTLYSPNSIRQLALELRPDSTETAFLMLYHGRIDTLVVTHTPRLQYVSMACGCAVYHTITNARSSDNRVDSILIINANIETSEQENLRIYMRE